ncbi:hypothetical protein ACFE04_014313 [Oxalis oulophora]
MVSLEPAAQGPRSINDTLTSPRISFSAEFFDDNKNFISITPHPHPHPHPHPPPSVLDNNNNNKALEKHNITRSVDFEFLLSNNVSSESLLTADELFFEGKLLPFWQSQQSEKLDKISLKSSTDHDDKQAGDEHRKKVNGASNHKAAASEAENKMNWFLDDDPSPRPPKCTVLWKELLKLKKQRAPSLSSSPSSSSSKSQADVEEGKESSGGNKDKHGNHHVKRIKKGLERTRSGSIRIRPMVNVAICTQVKTTSLPPLFPLKKPARLER